MNGTTLAALTNILTIAWSGKSVQAYKKLKGFNQAKEVTIAGGKIAGNAREELERQLGHSVLSSFNAKEPDLLDDSEKGS